MTTSTDLNRGEELIAGLLARQIGLLAQIRTLLAILVVLPFIGALIALVATSDGPVGNFFH